MTSFHSHIPIVRLAVTSHRKEQHRVLGKVSYRAASECVAQHDHTKVLDSLGHGAALAGSHDQTQKLDRIVATQDAEH